MAVLLCTVSVFASEWTTYFKSSDITIEYKYSDCNDVENGIHQQKVLFRFVNASTQKVEVSFNRQITYSNSDKSNNSDNVKFAVIIPANGQISCQCNTKDKSLYIFSKQLNIKSTTLLKFDLRNISINPTE